MGIPAIGCHGYLWYNTLMAADLASYRIPLSEAPHLVFPYSGFGSSIHGLRGSEPYRNGFWVLNVVEGGEGSLFVYDKPHTFHSGCAVIAPPNTDHRYDFAKPLRKTYAHFRAVPGANPAFFPVVQDLGERFNWFKATLIECAMMVKTEPDRVRATLWNLLWHLSSGANEGGASSVHPVIQKLLEWMTEHLAEPIEPDGLAFMLDCSASHLNRLCHAAFGLPLIAYIRQCRLERAEYLLTHTTRRAADIATEVGYPDLQHFNKLMRAYSGKAPRALRNFRNGT